jgi:hypothetical protein
MSKIYKAVGRTGEYFIEKSGYHPQAGEAFSYVDEKYRFWFYVEFCPGEDQENYRLRIKDATTERFEGWLPSVAIQDQKAIEDNIRSYFNAFDLFGCEITASNPAPIIEFTWMLSP